MTEDAEVGVGDAPTQSGRGRRANVHALARRAASMRSGLEAVWASVRRYPSTAIIPSVLLAGLLALGVWGVHEIAGREESSNKVLATSLARDTAAVLYGELSKVYGVLDSLAAVIMYTPQYSALGGVFQAVVPALVKQAPRGAVEACFASPNGIIGGAYPSMLLPMMQGVDIFAPPDTRAAAVSVIRGGAMAMALQRNELGPKEQWKMEAVLLFPVFIGNVSKDERFGAPAGLAETLCDACYNATTRTKWWGNLVVTVSLNFIAESARLRDLSTKGYDYQLVDPKGFAGSTEELLIAGTAGLPALHEVEVDVPNGKWLLRVQPRGGYRPSWMSPVMAAVVIAAFVVSLLLFVVLYARRHNQAMLEALLPKAVLEDLAKLKGGTAVMAPYTQHADTPADLIMDVMDELLNGRMPPLGDIVLVQTTIRQAYDIYRPIDIGNRIKDAEGMDAEVAQALMRQLGQADSIDERDRAAPRLASNLLVQLDRASGATVSTRGTQDGGGNCPIPIALIQAQLSASGAGAQSHLAAQKAACQELGGALALIMTRQPAGWDGTGDTSRRGQSRASLDYTALNSLGSEIWALAAEEEAGGTPRGTVALASSRRRHEVLLPPPPAVVEEAERLLALADGWQLDTFALHEATQGHALSALGYYLMHKVGLIKQFKLNPVLLARYLRHVESGYLDNPYHNAVHAADVLRALHVVLHQGRLTGHYVDRLGLMAAYMAAIVHDFGHLGLTNDFLIFSKAPLALRYNDRAPLENHHCAAAFEALHRPELNFLASISDKDMAALRKLVIEMVLSTDMKQHFGIISQFKTVHRPLNAQPTARGGSTRPSIAGQQPSIEPSPTSMTEGMRDRAASCTAAPCPQDEAERLLGLQVALKCADLGHLTAGLSVHVRWLERLEEEFFLQGDKERAAGLPISPLFDRAKQGASKSQVGFFDFVALPLFTELAGAFPGTRPMLEHALVNYNHWKAVEEEAKRAAAAAAAI